MSMILALWAREPVIISALVTAVIGLLVAFNVPLTEDQQKAIIGLVVAVGVIVARSQVSPVASAAKS